jgi:hypothetical protein
MAQYDKSIALATRLVAKFGGPAILRRFSDAAVPDPDQPWRRATGSPASTDEEINAVFLNFGDMGRSGERYSSEWNIQVGAKLVLISGGNLSAPPELRDRLYRDGAGPDDEGWSITKVQTLDPNGQNILYELQVDR